MDQETFSQPRPDFSIQAETLWDVSTLTEPPPTQRPFRLGGHDLVLWHSDQVFVPNTTTAAMFDAASDVKGQSVLDMGCGIGAIGIAAALSGAEAVTSVDVMPEACELARRNAELNGAAGRLEVRQSHLFEQLNGARYDLIISDVSGMAEKVARLSPWYPPSIPVADGDGVSLAVEVLANARQHLRPGGKLVFPIVGLSRTPKILAAAQSSFPDALEKVAEKMIPFHPQLSAHAALLEEMRAAGTIDFIRKGSRLCWKLEVYCATHSGR